MSEYRERTLKCPFCGEDLGEPAAVKSPFGDAVDGGKCKCGAVYVYDRSGRLLGEAYRDALALAFDWDYDKAFSSPTEDYEECVIRYNSRVRKFLGGEGDFKERSPKFYFVRRKK